MAADLLLKGLPRPWSFGVTKSGRIFFINDDHKITTWLHPTTGQTVGMEIKNSTDVPPPWEVGMSRFGVQYHEEHVTQETSFVHLATKESTIYREDIHDQNTQNRIRQVTWDYQGNTPTMDTRRSMRKKNSGTHSSPLIMRSSQAPVTMEGWLYKQDSKGLKQWKKRWFVLSDYCLFYYKGPSDEQNLGSILLPSYKINPCTGDDKTSRKNAFKAEHLNMRTYYFCAETKESMSQWMNCMSLASILQKHSSVNQIQRGNHYRHQRRHPDEDDSGFYNYKLHSNNTMDENSTLNSSMLSDIPQRDYSRDAIAPGFDSGNFSLYDSRTKSPAGSDNFREKNEHLYVNAPPKPFRCNASPYDEYMMEEGQCQEDHGPKHPGFYPDDQYRNQLRSKADSFFHDPSQRVPNGQTYPDSYRSANSPRNAPALPKKGVSRHTDHRLNDHSPGDYASSQNMADRCGRSAHRNDLVIQRETHCRASTRSLGNAASRVRPASTYQASEQKNRPSKQLTRDDSFTVNMGKNSKYKSERRETSMRRLLEWKQRMLQSPLSRNHKKQVETPPVASSPQRPPLPDSYHEQVLKELVNHENAALRTINNSFDSHSGGGNRWQNQGDRFQHPVRGNAVDNHVNQVAYRDKYTNSGRFKEDKLTPSKSGRPPSRNQDRRSSSLNRFKDSYSSEEEDETIEKNRRPNRKSNQHRPKYQNQSSHSSSPKINTNKPVENGRISRESPQISPAQQFNNVIRYPSLQSSFDNVNNDHSEPQKRHDNIDDARNHYEPFKRYGTANTDQPNSYDSCQTYEIGEDGPSKEELRYAQELLFQKYQNKLKMHTDDPKASFERKRDKPSYINVHNDIHNNLNQVENGGMIPHLQTGAVPEVRASYSKPNMSERCENGGRMVPKQLFLEHFHETIRDLSINSATPPPNERLRVDIASEGYSPSSESKLESFPSPEYHHLQYQMDDNTQERPISWRNTTHFDENYMSYNNQNESRREEEAYRDVPHSQPVKSLNSYENVPSSGEPINKSYENLEAEFKLEYKSDFGRETAKYFNNSETVDNYGNRAHVCDEEKSNNIMKYPDTMMYRLAHDTTLCRDNFPSRPDLSLEVNNNCQSVKEPIDQVIDKVTSKVNFSVEELRNTIKKVKEAPPANIVQQRIKHFEISSKPESTTPESITPPKKDPSSEKTSPRRRFYSDSEAVLYGDSSSESGVSDEDGKNIQDSGLKLVKYGNEVVGSEQYISMQPSIVEVTTVLDKQEPLYMAMDSSQNLQQMKNTFYSTEATGRYVHMDLGGSNFHYRDESNASQSSYKLDLKPPRHFRDSSQYSETDSRISVQSTENNVAEAAQSSTDVKITKNQCFNSDSSTNLAQTEGIGSHVSLSTVNPSPGGSTVGKNHDTSRYKSIGSASRGKATVLNLHNKMVPCLDGNLPDLLKHEEGEESVISEMNRESDYSDADDEASKDFDSAPVKKQFQSKLHFWYNKDKHPDIDSDSEKDSIPSYPPPPPPPMMPVASDLKDYYERSIGNEEIQGGIMDSPREDEAYAQYKMYEDDRRTTQFLVKPSTDTKKPKLLVKKIRIYDEGKPVENVQNYVLDADRPKTEAELPPTSVGLTNSSFDDDGGHYVGLRVPDSQEAMAGPQSACSTPPSQPESVKSEKSPNSAPYYYSDLLKDDSNVPNCTTHSQRIISRPVPNNIRSVSPSNIAQVEIGRRVNLIHQQEAEHLNAEVENNLRYPIGSQSEITPEIRCSLEQILGSQTEKFSGLDHNKYEAGNTLEKTRHLDNNKIKLRSATPDFDLTASRFTDEFHHSMALKNHNLLSRRLSRSMEDLLDSGTSAVVRVAPRPVVTKPSPPIPPPKPVLTREPYYENSAHLIRMSNLEISQEEHNSILAGRGGIEYVGSHDARPQAYPAKHSIPSNDLIGPSSEEHHFQEQPMHSNASFLGYGQPNPDTGPKYPSPMTDSFSSTNHFLGVGPKTDFKGGGEDTFVENEVANITSAPIISSTQSSYCSLDGEVNVLGTGCVISESDAKKLRPADDTNMSDSEMQVNSSSKLKRLVRQSEGLNNKGKRLSISAGELLGKTHEELVLLLIQLRRNQTKIIKARDQCRRQLDNVKNNVTLDSNDILLLQQQYNELDNQSEATRPLINLVDNMVKLGSLYGGSDKMLASQYKLEEAKDYVPPKAMIEFSRKMQEKKLVQGSREELNNMTPEEVDLEDRLQQLFRLDRELQEESTVLSNFQNDKEILEKTLEGIKKKILDAINESERDKMRKHQKLIEKELFKVKTSLASSVKKLEDKTTENSRVEHEILILRQKIHQSLMKLSSRKSSNENTSKVEAELARVQSMLDELADRRKELCNAVNMFKISSTLVDVRASPTGISGSAALPGKKRPCTTYFETDMDTYISIDVGGSNSPLTVLNKAPPIYVNTEVENENNPLINYNPQDISDADDKTKRFYGIIPKEKPSEIKTVRIVKREAERRHKDKKKVTYDDSSLVQVIEHHDNYDDEEEEEKSVDALGLLTRSLTLPRNFNSQFNQNGGNPVLSAHERLFGESNTSNTASPVKTKPKETIRKVSIKKPKRRHHTIIGSSQTLPSSSNDMKMPQTRSRDDVDMEHCLRTVNTPDVVKSTIKKRDVYDHDTIDRELGLPQKISIPERYVEFEPEPQLSVAEQLVRSQKAASIRKMLSESAQFDAMLSDPKDISKPTETLKMKVDVERRKREQLLALNQAIAKEVMQKSKFVAGNTTPSPEIE